ncbi:MAG TPA: ABC transporter permease [Clostridiaceae bacterium]|nr:ABC transporter permease [Clostridiaceae bacterium]
MNSIKNLVRSKTREIALIVVIVLISTVVALISKGFLNIRNLTNILNNNAILGIMSIGMMIVIVTGNIDVSVGAQFAACVMVTAAYVKMTDGNNPILAFIISMATGILLGMFNGFFIAKFNIPAIIVTLGTLSIIRGGLMLITNGSWISDLKGVFIKVANYKLGIVTVSVYVWLFVMLFTYLMLYHTRIGRSIVAVGGNKNAAERIGINRSFVYIFSFGFMGALSGVSAALYASKLAIAQPTAGMGVEMKLIAAAVIGGTMFTGGIASIFGTFLGTVLFGLIENALVLTRVPVYWQSLATGVVLIAAIVSSAYQAKEKHAKGRQLIKGGGLQ